MSTKRVISIATIAGVIALSYFVLLSVTTENESEVFIDYENLQLLAQEHPNGEKLLKQIRDGEEILSDDSLENDVDGYLSIAFAFRQFGDDRTAILMYQRVLAIDPEHTLALNNMAVSFRDLQEFDEAQRTFREIIKISPGDVNAYRNFADAYIAAYPNDESFVVILQGGLDVASDPGDILTYLGSYYSDRGNKEKAIEYFERFLKIHPGNVAVIDELRKLRN